LAFLTAALGSVGRPQALEVSTEASAGRDFLHLDTGADATLLGDRLVIGGGLRIASDLQSGSGTRAGARGEVGYRGDLAGATLRLGYAPPQHGRGWIDTEVEATLRLEGERVDLDLGLTASWQRVDVGLLPDRVVGVEALRAAIEATLVIDERVELSASFVRASYSPALPARAHAVRDLGLLIGVAAAPERNAVAVRASWRFRPQAAVEAGLSFIDYADPGFGFLPRAAIRAGPFRGFSAEASLGWVRSVGSRDPRDGPLVGLAVLYER
jgi:hypothetical protein